MTPRQQLTGGSLFSGIGGMDLGMEQVGVRILWQCESDSFCQRVLSQHWPDVPCYDDIKEIDHETPKVDVLFGGFPCQPVSVAGERKVRDDPRWLWPEFARTIAVLRPGYVFVENVAGLRTAGMGFVLASLATLGYDAEWDSVSAASVGAPHLRERIFILAHTNIGRTERGQGARSRVRNTKGSKRADDHVGRPGEVAHTRGVRRDTRRAKQSLQRAGPPSEVSMAHAKGTGRRQAKAPELRGCEGATADAQGIYAQRHRNRQGQKQSGRGGWWTTEPDVGRVAHGVPARVDRLKGLGNAAVPAQVAFAYRLLMERMGDEPPVTRPMTTVPLFG